jgi:hypothetical protein
MPADGRSKAIGRKLSNRRRGGRDSDARLKLLALARDARERAEEILSPRHARQNAASAIGHQLKAVVNVAVQERSEIIGIGDLGLVFDGPSDGTEGAHAELAI